VHYKKILSKRILIFLVLVLGFWEVYMSKLFLGFNTGWKLVLSIVAILFFFVLAGRCIILFRRGLKALNFILDNTSIEVLLGGTAGLIVGILVGALSSYPLSMVRGAGSYLILAVFFLSGYMGLKIGTRRAYDVFGMFPRSMESNAGNNCKTGLNPKILDTSAIIDGRIYDVCLSRFLEGTLLVPTFVIKELQHIADSSDYIRRSKGRRGLELLSKMQKHPEIKIDIIDTMEANVFEEKEVDGKLIQLCKHIGASIVTNDYDLNKVAELQGLTVLNINELANAVKMIVYPGETMHINIIKEGKEEGQGVGYLDDGTMVVVEDARDEIGNDLEVMVTSIFQTAAGRMIFTRKVKEETRSRCNNSLQDMREVNIYG